MEQTLQGTSHSEAPTVLHQPPKFALSDKLKVDTLSEKYGQKKRIHIPGILETEGAVALRAHLRDDTQWSDFLYGDNHLWEVGPDERRDMTTDKKAALDEFVHTEAQKGYAFHYQMNKITELDDDGYTKRAPHTQLMQSFSDFLNSEEMLGFIRKLTGHSDVVRTEANCTHFGIGQWLAAHDDSNVATRRAAYVVNLTTDWKMEYGGLLEFITDDGHVAEGYTPIFNSFNIFSVPVAHQVSCVAPFATGGRLAISGWFHSAE